MKWWKLRILTFECLMKSAISTFRPICNYFHIIIGSVRSFWHSMSWFIMSCSLISVDFLIMILDFEILSSSVWSNGSRIQITIGTSSLEIKCKTIPVNHRISFIQVGLLLLLKLLVSWWSISQFSKFWISFSFHHELFNKVISLIGINAINMIFAGDCQSSSWLLKLHRLVQSWQNFDPCTTSLTWDITSELRLSWVWGWWWGWNCCWAWEFVDCWGIFKISKLKWRWHWRDGATFWRLGSH